MNQGLHGDEEDEEGRGCCACCAPKEEERELRSWYIYDFGIGPIALAIIVFAPLLVVTQAKYEASKGGVIEWRHTTSDGDLCAGNVTVTSDEDFRRPEGISDKCKWFPLDTKVPGIEVDYTAIAAYISALVLFFSGLSLVVMGPIGDFGSLRRPILALCVAIWGLCFAIPIGFASFDLYLVNGILIFVGATAWNFGNRALRNAYLPLLVRSNPLVQEKMKLLGASAMADTQLQDSSSFDRGEGEEGANGGTGERKEDEGRRSDESMASHNDPKTAINKLSEQFSSQYSITTSAYFFVGQILGFIVQGLFVTLLAPTETDPSNTFGLRLSLAFAAVFGLVFCAKSILGLGARPGPRFGGGKFAALTVGGKRVYGTVKLMQRDMREMSGFLVGRTLHWTAVQSILTTATLYIEREYSMSADDLVVPLVVMILTSTLGAFGLGAIVKKYENAVQKITVGVCCVTNLIPLYMLLGMRQEWEIYFLFVLAGLLVSPFPALSRGILAQMIPLGYSSTIMSLEGILELGTSWIGPFVIGLIVDLTGSVRWGCFSMSFIMAPALPFLMRANLRRAADQKLAVEKTKAAADAIDSQASDIEMFQLVPG